MKIDEDVVNKVARISRLNLSKSEVERFTPELKEILDSFSRISEIDTKGAKMSIQPIDVRNNSRDDKPGKCLSADDALRNSAHRKDGYFRGPRAI
ncbi:Asp-tRNA(Asn)/Glu-tRNA(Gln) amidotransferase subunit GatC [Candidatus Woesearchaeota archaeon]|nr:Asp-tRNA(Asn)/Glu-tRNA(Gln) amidotransferase subunit GatC [Candidatus Woesearchaeota archaeon]